MPKIDMFQCDNRHCPDASETRGDPLESDWLVLQGEGGPRFFCKLSCLKAWLEQYMDGLNG
jgi:hypothetical protein